MSESSALARYQTLLILFSVWVGLCLGGPGLVAATGSSTKVLEHARQLIQQGNLAGARVELAEGLKEFPNEAGFYDLLGVVEAQQGNPPAAESDFKKALELDPRFAGAYLNLGHLYQESAGKIPDAQKKALATYQKLLQFDPGNVEANYQAALLLELRGQFSASLERLGRLPPAAQQRPQALAVSAADFAGLGKRLSAEAQVQRLLSRPDLTEEDALLSLPALKAHRASDLEGRLLEGLDMRGLASPKSLHELAQVYREQSRLNKARETLERVAAGQPDSVAILTELARVANDQHDSKGALGYLAHARDVEPQNAAVHFFFGMVSVEENLAQEAYTSLKQAVSLAPENPFYNYALGAVAVSRDDPREALPYFRKYCELMPSDPRGKFALGAAYFYSHDFDSARAEFARVVARRETASGAHCFLGRIANQEGKLDEAASELEQALKYNPLYADALAELGHVRLNRKEYRPAEQALRRALEVDRDNYTANLNLMMLYQRTHDPRAEEQARRFEEVRKKRSERAKEFLRTIEVRP